MASRRLSLPALLCLLCSSVFTFGQGIQPFHTIQNNGYDAVDIGTGGVVVTATIRDKSAAGFSFGATIDSTVLKDRVSGRFDPGGNSFREARVGSLVFDIPTVNCGGQIVSQHTNFRFVDGSGAVHLFPNVKWDSGNACGTVLTDSTTDGSGLTLSTTLAQAQSGIYPVYDVGGGKHLSTAGGGNSASYTDTNGNVVSYSLSPLNSWSDMFTPGVLNIVSGGYTYKDAANTLRQVNTTYVGKTFQVACSANTFTTSFITNISYPDNSSIQLTYEPSQPGSQNITGRLQSLTLRSGGTINYSYSGGTSGINCGDGSTAILTRQTPDGTWTYNHTLGTWPVSYTTVTDPSGNDTAYTFANGYEIYHQVYQGHVSGGTLLATVGTCYNGATNCQGQTSVTLPITEVDKFTTIPGVSGSSAVKRTYTSTGLLTRDRKFDFSASTPTVDTTISYGTNSNGTCLVIGNHIVDRPCTIIVKNGAGTAIAQTVFTYDSHGNRTSTSKWTGTTWLTTYAAYNPNGSLVSTTDENNAVTTYSNNTCNGLVPQTITRPLSLVTSMTWDCAGGVVTSTTDPNGGISQTEYVLNEAGDPLYRPLGNTDPLGNFTWFYYQPNAQYTPSTEFASFMQFGSSETSNINYKDGLGRTFTHQRLQAPGTTNFDTVSYGFDANGRLASATAPCSTVGWSATCPVGTPTTTYTYDALNRPLVTTDAGGGTMTHYYNAGDVLVTMGPAPAGEHTKQRQYEYNGLGQLISVCEITNASGSGPCGQRNSSGLNFSTGFVTTYAYDTLGNLKTVSQGGQTRSFVYDALGRMTSETNPESGTTTYVYDTAANPCGWGSFTNLGDLIQKTDANGKSVCLQHDALHRLTAVGNNAQSTVNAVRLFRYDNVANGVVPPPAGSTISNVVGQLMEAETDYNGVITDEWFSYNARGELTDTWQSTPHSGGYYRSSASYFPNGAVNTLAGYLASGSTFVPTQTYSLDGEGRPNSVAAASGPNPVSNVSYNPASQITGITYGSTDTDAFIYDAAGRMKKFTYTLSGSSEVGTLTWSPNGTLDTLVITDPFNAGNVQSCNYAYDDLARITSANCGTPWSQTFSYDRFGNVTKAGSIQWQPGYNQTTNRYALAGSSYDANGNLTNDTLHTFAWDVYNRPSTIAGKTMTYDAIGRMVEKQDGANYTQFVYSPLGGLFARMSGQSATSVRVPLPGSWAVYGGSSSFNHYEHLDWLGNSRLSSNQSRQMTSDMSYAPFGEPYASSSTSGVSFTGMRSDVVAASGAVTTGIYDFPARELPPSQGRWISPDPAGRRSANPNNPQSWNRYAYVLNNPLSITDPTGLEGDSSKEPATFVYDGTNATGASGAAFSDLDLLEPSDGPDQVPYIDPPQREASPYDDGMNGFGDNAMADYVFHNHIWGQAYDMAEAATMASTAISGGLMGGTVAMTGGAATMINLGTATTAFYRIPLFAVFTKIGWDNVPSEVLNTAANMRNVMNRAGSDIPRYTAYWESADGLGYYRLSNHWGPLGNSIFPLIDEYGNMLSGEQFTMTEFYLGYVPYSAAIY